jgi:hypothetical protein
MDRVQASEEVTNPGCPPDDHIFPYDPLLRSALSRPFARLRQHPVQCSSVSTKVTITGNWPPASTR